MEINPLKVIIIVAVFILIVGIIVQASGHEDSGKVLMILGGVTLAVTGCGYSIYLTSL